MAVAEAIRKSDRDRQLHEHTRQISSSLFAPEMKRCTMCAEMIPKEAKKCAHCLELQDQSVAQTTVGEVRGSCSPPALAGSDAAVPSLRQETVQPPRAVKG